MDRTLFLYKGIKGVLVTLGLLTAVQAIMIILQAYYLADSISSLFGGDLFYEVVGKLLLFALAFLARHLLSFFKKRVAYRFAARTSTDLRESVLKKLFLLGPRFVKDEGSGQTVALVMEGTSKFRRYLELFLPKLLNTIIIPAFVCAFVFMQNIRSAVILIIAVPILIAFMILLGLAAKEKANRQFRSYQMLSNHFVDSLRGLETLKYLGLSRKHIENIRLVSEEYRKATMSTLRVAFLSSFALDILTMLSIATVAVFLGLGLINGTIDLKPALTVLILAPEYFLPLREVGADYHATLDGKEAGQKFQEILKRETAVSKQISVPKWNSGSVFASRGVRFQYPGSNDHGLSQLDFSISGMRKIGIIGASGAGKSTLIDLLGGFLSPTDGEFSINGQMLASLAQEGWQKQVTYIPQHPYIFADTIMNNIRFYEPEATEEEVMKAAKLAGIYDVIQSLPEKFHTRIGEGGRMLSGGQEQRIALARAFLTNRPILLLDEPTAHLDIETEADLKKTMLALFQGKLVFFATHRLHWMLDMDQIFVLDQGRLAETGTHAELLSKKGFYYRLVQAQLEGM
jgi:ATP-binding cassette subfamily C protein CydD